MYGALAIAGGVIVATIAVAAVMRFRAIRRGAIDRGDGGDLARVGRTRDARGRVVKLLDPFPLYLLNRHDVIETDALEGIAKALEPGVRGRRRLLLLPLFLGGGTLAFVGLVVAIEGRTAWTDVVATFTNPAIIAALVGGLVVPLIAAREQRLRRVRDVMLRHRRCPHCGYGLTGVPISPDDGATVCPECACAWRLDDPALAATTGDGPAATDGRRRAVWTAALLLGLSAMLAAGLLAFFMAR